MTSIAVGLLLFARTPVDATYAIDLMPPMILIGARRRPRLPVADDARDVGRDAERLRVGLGLVNTSVQVGGAIGLAVLATFATERTDALLADGVSSLEALNSGYHLAYLIGAALVGVAIAVALVVLRSEESAAAAAEDIAREPRQGEPAYSEA